MKKALLSLALVLSGFSISQAQFSFSITQAVCFNSLTPASNTTTAFVMNTPTNSSQYYWNIAPANSTSACVGSYTGSSSTNTSVTITFPCCGVYSITAFAMNGSTVVATSLQTFTVSCNAGLYITSPTNYMVCSGSPAVLNAYGAMNYVWSDGTNTISTSNIATVTPTATTCYTVTGSVGAGCSNSAVACVSVGVSPTVSIGGSSSSTNNCQYSSYTLTASGAASYAWIPTWLGTGAVKTTWLGSSSCYTVIGTASNGCTASAVHCPTFQAGPSVSITASPGQTVCPGTGVNLSVPVGATGYTWQTGSSVISNSATAYVVPTSTAWNNYSVSATNSLGCYSYTNITLYVNPLPNVTVVGGNNLCIGNSSTLIANFPGPHTWSVLGSPVGTGSVLVVSPTVNTCYSIADPATGCIRVNCIFPVNPPTLTVSATSTTNNCAYSGFTLNASGATSYAWFYASGGNFANAATTIVGPAANTCYTVIGQSAPGCTASAAVCVTVQPGPVFNVSASSLTVCAGSPAYLSATGGVNYTWSAGNYNNVVSNSSTANIIPTGNNYTVWVTATNSQGCPSYTQLTLYITPSPSINVSGSYSFCAGQTKVLSTNASGPYSWSDGSSVISTASSVVVSPTTSTCYTLTLSGSGSCSVVSTCLFLTSPPSLTISAPSTMCSNSGSWIYVQGASTYSWSHGLGSSSSPFINPQSNTCYTVTGFNSAGCSAMATTCMTVIPGPVISNNLSYYAVCAGRSVTLATSSNSYSWQVGIHLGPWIYNSTGTNIVVTPTASATYSYLVMNQGCFSIHTATVAVIQPPTLNISGSGTVCAGGSINLTATGANSYSWSNNATTNMISVSPASSTCYTVTGTNNFGCSASAVKCVTVLTAPVVISPASATVCLGTSHTFTGSGASSYTWSTGANTSTLNVLPSTTTSYTLYGTGSNGCPGSAVATLVVNPNCSDVWPGDANSDGIVGTTDVLEIGLAFLSSGAARNPGGNNYVAQHATNWSGTVSSGKNKCHADCDGNGTVTLADTMAIFTNFGQSHPFRLSAGTDPDIRVVTDAQYFIAGEWNKVDIFEGDENDIQLYGLTFDLGFDNTLVEDGEAYLVYTASFLNNSTQNVEFRKGDFENGIVYAATVRTDHTNVNGKGKIAVFHFRIKEGTEGQYMALSAANSERVDKDGNHTTQDGNSLLVQIAANDVGINEHADQNDIRIQPNPASDLVVLKSGSIKEIRYSVSDISGRIVRTGAFTGTADVQTENFASGVYFIHCASGGLQSTHKLVIQH